MLSEHHGNEKGTCLLRIHPHPEAHDTYVESLDPKLGTKNERLTLTKDLNESPDRTLEPPIHQDGHIFI